MKMLIAMLVLVVLLVRGRAEDSVPAGHEPRMQCTASQLTGWKPVVFKQDLIEETIKSHEGWRAKAYTVGQHEISIGYGCRLTAAVQPHLDLLSNGRLRWDQLAAGRQSVSYQEGLLILRWQIDQKKQQARKAIADFDRLPERVQAAVVDGFFRGDLSGSPKTLKLINAGRWQAAARELLDNNEYRTTKLEGVRRRMEWRAEVFKSYGEGRL